MVSLRKMTEIIWKVDALPSPAGKLYTTRNNAALAGGTNTAAKNPPAAIGSANRKGLRIASVPTSRSTSRLTSPLDTSV